MDKEEKLLKDFFMFFREYGEDYIGLTVEELVCTFLKQRNGTTN